MRRPFDDSTSDRLGLAAPSTDRLDVVSCRGGQVRLWGWRGTGGPGTDETWGPDPLPGVVALGSPAVVSSSSGRLDIFVRTVDHQLAWTALSGTSGFTGWRPLARYLAHDPVAVSYTERRIDVFAVSVSGHLRHWSFDGDAWQAERRREWGCGRPAILTGTDGYSLFGTDAAADVRHYICRPGRDRDWIQVSEPPIPGPGTGDLEVVDTVAHVDLWGALAGDGVLHWGWWQPGGLGMWFRDDPAVQPWLPIPVLDGSVSAVNGAYELVGRGQDGTPVVFWFSEDQRRWQSAALEGRADSLPAGTARGDQRSYVAFVDGVLTHWYTGGPGFADRVRWDSGPMVDDTWWTGVGDAPDYLATRPEDLVVLGVTLRGTRPSPDGGSFHVAGPDATLVLTFPPQHIGEQVFGPDPLPPGASARGRLSGRSQLAFRLPEGARVPLTVAGVLEAVTGPHADLVPSRKGPGGTIVELPWRLAFTVADAAAIVEHAHAPVASATGGVGLWSSRLRSRDGADVAVRPLGADRADPYELPLAGADRFLISQLGADAVRLGHLDLTALGATFDARAQADGFGWEHRGVLGRDQRVRTTRPGFLFCFGHRAVYVESTERVLDPDGAEPAAVLRKSRTLQVLEPVREWTPTPAFPFHRVEILTTVLTGLAPPVWTTVDRSVDLAGLTYQLERVDADLADLEFGVGHGPASIESLAETSEDARRYVELRIERERISRAIAEGGHRAKVEVLFTPHPDATGPAHFRVRLSGRHGDVECELPLVFVSDLRLPGRYGLQPFTTAGNEDVASMAREAFHGEVSLPATAVDVCASEPPERAFVLEVRGLNLDGRATPDGYAPTLGPVHPGAEERNWAMAVALPAVRQLTGEDVATRMRFADDYLRNRGDHVLTMLDDLDVDLTRQARRVGALAGPQFCADTVSRTHGPLRAAGQVPGADGHLIPSQMLGDGARLLGLDLRQLIRPAKLAGPPTLTHTFDGAVPIATLAWGPVGLICHGGLVASDDSALTMSVTTGAHPTTTCTLTSVGIAVPAIGPLLTLRFATLKFVQEPEDPPRLEVVLAGAEFHGALGLLQGLQRAVRFDGPRIDHTASAVTASYGLSLPEVACGTFRLSNIAFDAAVRIPFSPPGITVSVGFASRANPFTVGVLAFGGGGYARVVLDGSGVRELEVALEFGASLAVNLGVARADVHALGGAQIAVRDDRFRWTGYLRLGGSVELLGLVSVSVEIRLELTHDEDRNALWGRATLVVEVDVTLTSFDIELDTGIWVLAGGDTPPSGDADVRPAGGGVGGGGRVPAADEAGAASSRAAWERYRGSFALEELT